MKNYQEFEYFMTTAREDGKHYKLEELRGADILTVIDYEMRHLHELEKRNKKERRKSGKSEIKKTSYDGSNPREVADNW